MNALHLGLVKIGLGLLASFASADPILLVLVGCCLFLGMTDLIFECVEFGGEE